ncbi:MAG: hypothetical protein ACOC8I_04025 [Desulfosalsimonas sp.]
MKKYSFGVIAFIFIIGFSAWLYSDEQASEPGGLSSAHEAFGDCRTCHVPWRGADDKMCMQCHFFDRPEELRPQIRFHEAGKHCLKCHTEHRGRGGDISKMDHTLLSGALDCTNCHVDPHMTMFGSDCRECHGINQWEIEGFRHPSDENRNCHRCHRAPDSHYHEGFWEDLREGHIEWRRENNVPSREECWQCHITHRWDHLRMPH